MNDTPICPCDRFEHPKIISNPPGRDTLAYRTGDYIAFREALLLSLEGETQLQDWRPTATDDLALQMVEWWAYLADILTFYNERIANQAYLRTAELPESVQRLIRLLGYRPRPGIGATGVLAALVNSRTPVKLPQGLPLQSKPGPGQEPQVFELDRNAQVGLPDRPDRVAVNPAPNPALLSADRRGLLLKGAVTTVKAGDRLLILKKGWNGMDKNYALGTVADIQQQKDPRGNLNTRLNFVAPFPVPNDAQAEGVPDNAQATDYRLLKSVQSAHVWQYKASAVIKSKQVDLEAIVRNPAVGDPVLFEIPDAASKLQLVRVTSYTEVVWYANPPADDPTVPPNPRNIPPIPITHTRLTFRPALTGITNKVSQRQVTRVHHTWQEVGQLTETPATTFSAVPATLTVFPPVALPQPINNQPVLLEDTDGKGVQAKATTSADWTSLQLTDLPEPSVPLTPPLQVLFNLLPVSRGKTVLDEILGSGDASLAGQEFVLQKSPLTYLSSRDSKQKEGYKSTLRIWVDKVEWQEAASFYGQTPDAHIFVTREDENNKTHVLFGDGINGARLPSGVNNIVASYRYGSGAEAPSAGALTVIQQPQPGLKAVRNPVAVGAGADPDPPAQIRRYAPQSVLTFGRAVSANDYETIAAQTPGVARARAYWTFDATLQRTLIMVYVGDDNHAVTAAREALARAGDPNRPVQVRLASSVQIKISLILLIDSRFEQDAVRLATRAALLDPDTGLFGIHVVRIGQSIFRSQIFSTCLKVPGVLAVHRLHLAVDGQEITQAGYTPATGRFLQLQAEDLTLALEVAGNV